MNFLFVSILVFISPTLSEIREDFFLPYPKLRSIFSKLKKRQGDGGYLEQCGIVDFGQRKLGTVNVLAFFDAGWQYSHRQAAMLKELKVRFERSGMMDINFFVINSSPTTIIDEEEIEIEEDTWKAISPTEAEGLPLVETSLESLNKTLGPEFYLIKDNSQLQIWKKLHVSRDQILVVDGCGKLTYQVIVPWSILHFPYVKAAILSTYKDEPCGPCKKCFEEDKPEEMRKELIGAEELKISDGRATTSLTIEETSTEKLETDGTTTRFGLEERTREEMKTVTDDTTTIRLEIEETTTEQTKIDGTVPISLEVEGTTIEQLVSDAATTILLDIEEETTRKQIKTVGAIISIPSEIEETTTGEIKTDEATTEQTKTDGTIPILPEIEVTTIPQMISDAATTIRLNIEEETTLKQLKTDGAMFMPSEIEETTTEQMKTDEITTVSIEIEKETTTEQIKTGGTVSIPSEIKETKTEQAKTSTKTTIRLQNQETITEQIKADGTIPEPSEIEGITIEQVKTDAGTTVPLIIEEETTEEIKTADDTTARSLKIQETTPEQIKADEKIPPSSIVKETTTVEVKNNDDTTTIRLEDHQEITTEQTKTDVTIPLLSKIKETTTVEVTIDDTTTTRLENQETTTKQTKTNVLIPLPSEIEETTPKEIKTKFSETYLFNFQEKDHKSENPSPETETLKPTLDLANNNSEDMEYILSKFPNVRSISKDIYNNQLSLDRNSQNEFNKTEENSKFVPIRIIMKAPHLDIYENSLIKHDYLILMTGDPNIHDHFDRGIKIDSSDGNFEFEEGSADFENRDIWKIEDRDLNQNEDEIKINNLNKSRNGWYGFRVKIEENVNKDLRKIKKRIFGKDESPGLYGEVADYWRNDGIENFYEEAFDNEDDKIYDMENDPSDYAEISEDLKSENYLNGTEETNEMENQKEKNTAANSINNEGEEEAKSKLIAHYSKLLPWIYYVLN